MNPPHPRELLHDAYHAGLGLPDMTPWPAVTEYVAENYYRYTTTEPPNPGPFREYRRERKLERTLDTIADRVEQRFRDVPEFAESFEDGTFPLALARAFNNIGSIHGENVHLKNHRKVDGRDDGDIFIEETTFIVEPGSTQLLNTIFTKLLHKNIPKDAQLAADVHLPVVVADEGEGDIPPTIKIRNVSEHDIRAMGRAVDATVWRWLRNQDKGLHIPTDKMPPSSWEKRGHTFPVGSFIEHIMTDVDSQYLFTPATANYGQEYADQHLSPIRRMYPLGTDTSGIFQKWRNIINGLGHHLRHGSSAYNLEQNPNRYDRLSLEEGIELRRTAATVAGPGSTRLPTGAETADEALRQMVEDAKKNTFRTAVKAARTILGLGLVDAGLAAAVHLPTGIKFTKELSEDAAAYRKQRREFALGRAALGNIVWKEIMGERFAQLDAIAEAKRRAAAQEE